MKRIANNQNALSLCKPRSLHEYSSITHKFSRQTLAVALLCIGFSHTTLADTEYRRDHGLYLGIGAGLGYLNPRDTNAEIRVEEQKDVAGQVFIGLDLGSRFGAELTYSHLGEADLTDAATLRYREASVSGLVYGFNTKENRQKREGLYGYGRVGLGRLFTEAEGIVEHRQDNDYHLLLGAGAEYGFTNGLAVRGEYLSYDHDAKSIQLSVLYRFNRKSESNPLPAPPPEITEPVAVTSSDTDQDDVPDSSDLCPDTTVGTKVHADGCPVYDGQIEGVNFVTNSAELLPAARESLDVAAAELEKFPNVVIKIMAHTDSRGAASYNLDLSARRAESVANYLLSKGIARSRLIPQAFGESFPIAPNATPEGRFRNRRVEFDAFYKP